MPSNLDRYKKDFDALLSKGHLLLQALQAECFRNEFRAELEKRYGEKAEEIIKALPSFVGTYQHWYSEAKTLIRQLMPDRLADFVRYYEKPKPRKGLDYENYRIEDCLQGLCLTRESDNKQILGREAAIPAFQQQLAILESVKSRFKSSLFDIRQLVQADLFDSELDAAKELAKKKFTRAAGALASVVLEKHLDQVCDNHRIKIKKKNPTIGDLNDLLKNSAVIDVPEWRFIQHLADIRNLCDHNKKKEPTVEQVDNLIAGVMKTTKTLF